jgi:hypothetical protein
VGGAGDDGGGLNPLAIVPVVLGAFCGDVLVFYFAEDKVSRDSLVPLEGEDLGICFFEKDMEAGLIIFADAPIFGKDGEGIVSGVGQPGVWFIIVIEFLFGISIEEDVGGSECSVFQFLENFPAFALFLGVWTLGEGIEAHGVIPLVHLLQ